MADAREFINDSELVDAVMETEEILTHMEGTPPENGVVLRVLVAVEGDELINEEILTLEGIPEPEDFEEMYTELAVALKEHIEGEVIALILAVRGFASVDELNTKDETITKADDDDSQIPIWMVSAETADGRTCGAFFLDKGEDGLEPFPELEVKTVRKAEQEPVFGEFRLDFLLQQFRQS